MLPADRALTPRLLATFQKQTIREPLFRNRSTTAYNHENERLKSNHYGKGWSKERGNSLHQSNRDTTPQTKGARSFNLADESTRRQISKGKNFPQWIIKRLETLISTSQDGGFSRFLRNLISALSSTRLLLRIETDDGLAPRHAQWSPSEQLKPLSVIKALQTAFVANGEAAVDTQLKYSYQGLLTSRNFSKADLANQTKLADLRYPVEWYAATRTIQRTVHLHVGPTNSGKTYHALKRLEAAESGVYAGPLRLLAHEVYTRLNARGKRCDLITGDERILQKEAITGAAMQSCTVEMVPLNTDVDVAVIDEIQMIGHEERGWAWTQALLGLKAEELHLCGEERTVPLIRELVASMGDKLEVHTYKRLSPLKTMSVSLGGRLQDLRKGDCVVVFSRVGIHAMKKEIEQKTQKRVAIIYGSLPPETRAQQAKLFNDPENDYDVLVASDAIGMGLNLAIKRIIFETVTKFNGASYEVIGASHIKQIAGRAGRFRTARQTEEAPEGGTEPSGVLPAPTIGLISTLEESDLPLVRKAMQDKVDPIMTAGIFPPTSVLLKFAAYFPPSINFSYILLRLHELSLLHPRYHLCILKEQISIADAIQPVTTLTTKDRIIFCASPANARQLGMTTIVAAFARCVGENSSGALLDIPEVPLEILDEEISYDRNYMGRLEALHKALILYLWLSYRFAGVFIDQDMAFYVKRLVEERIDKILAEFSSSPAIRSRIQKMREETLRRVKNLESPTSDSDAPTETSDSDPAPGLADGQQGDYLGGTKLGDSVPDRLEASAESSVDLRVPNLEEEVQTTDTSEPSAAAGSAPEPYKDTASL